MAATKFQERPFRVITSRAIATEAARVASQRIFQAVAAEAARVAARRQFQRVAIEAASLAAANLWQFEDVEAMYDYLGEGFRDLNQALRSNTFTEQVEERVNAVIQATTKLPTFQGLVYRGTDHLPLGTDLQVGHEFQDPGFLSTSRDRGRAFQGQYLFHIQSLHGYDIMDHSLYQNEEEVLFLPGTRFVVTSVETDVWDNRTVVEMEEIIAVWADS